VQAEVFVLRLRGAVPELAGPCGPDPWYIEVGADDDPLEVVGRPARNLMGEPLLVHSTSWRRSRGSVILSFIVVNHDGQAAEMAGLPVGRAELARSEATHAPAAIAHQQVLDNGLRHLAWLVNDDSEALSGRRGSNPQLQPWEGCTLPLSYSRTDLISFRAFHPEVEMCAIYASSRMLCARSW
jgi:hypothetical protein